MWAGHKGAFLKSDYWQAEADEVIATTGKSYVTDRFQKALLKAPQDVPWELSPAMEDPASDMPASETAEAAEASTSNPSATGPGADLSPLLKGTGLP